MRFQKVAILGGGNLGTSICRGLIHSGMYVIDDVTITERREHRIEHLQNKGFKVTNDNAYAVSHADLVIIAVKPQQASGLLNEIRNVVHPKKHVVFYTIAGVKLEVVNEILHDVPLFRIMPNTAVEICESMTCVSSMNADEELEKDVMDLLNKLGKTVVISEELMGAATVLGACGIAFALRFMRAATQGGIEIGFGSDLSQLITAQTIKGATELILKSGNHPEREIDKVTTPQGITISGLNEMEHQGFSSALIKGLLTSYNKLMKFYNSKSNTDQK